MLNLLFRFAFLELCFSRFNNELNCAIIIDPGLDTNHLRVK